MTTDARSHRYDVNCSILFTELPLYARPAAVREAGFGAVEYWWPFAEVSPPGKSVDAFTASIGDAGMRLVSLNFAAGDLTAGDRGLVSSPDRAAEFRDSVQIAVAIGELLGCRFFNALYGNRHDGIPAARHDEVALENLAYAAKAVGAIGGTVLLEALSSAPRYPLRVAADAIAIAERVNQVTRRDSCRILADVYHLTVNGDDVGAVIREHASSIGHVQFADAPGRGAPGTGQIDFAALLRMLDESSYQGWIGLEYQPGGPSADSFGWLPPERRSPGAQGQPEGARA
ncbi:MAG TPA: TIM barrel protein [Streptosporangiaceae bacterium]